MNKSISITVFSFRSGDYDKKKEIENALLSLPMAKSKVILFPGWSLGKVMDVNCTITFFTHLSKFYNSYIFADILSFQLFCPDGSIYPITFRQLFKDHKDASPLLVEKLISQLSNGDRIVEIFARKFGLIICGENNVLTNQQAQNNNAIVRHSVGTWPLQYEILLNPSHTLMGNWGKLERRFSVFSSNNRWAFYCTNNSNISDTWKSCLRVYYNGFLVRDGNSPDEMAENWRSISIVI